MLAFLFSPSDRFSRRQWWLAQMFITLTLLFLLVIPGTFPANRSPAFTIGYWLGYLPLPWMMFCSHVKRLHDLNKSAWWSFLVLVPFLGPFFLGYLGGWPGDLDTNKYGLAPHGITKQVIL